MEWARLAATMWGWKTLTSTLMPTAFPPQMVPTVEMVDLPLSNVLPLQSEILSVFWRSVVLQVKCFSFFVTVGENVTKMSHQMGKLFTLNLVNFSELWQIKRKSKRRENSKWDFFAIFRHCVDIVLVKRNIKTGAGIDIVVVNRVVMSFL